jgi:hypothetical protein
MANPTLMSTVLAFKDGSVKLDAVPKGIQKRVQSLASEMSLDDLKQFSQPGGEVKRYSNLGAKPHFRRVRSA